MRIGIVGLGTMGRALAENLLDHGVEVAGWNLEPEATARLAKARPEFSPATSLASLANTLSAPRVVLLMVPAGEAVDATLDELMAHLAANDIIIDAGNSHYEDTQKRATAAAMQGLRYVGLGVSGGENGARHGPSMMFGGPESAWEELREPLTRIAAQSEYGACVTRVGPAPAGHFVKMLHNGIEYADMQLIAEAYDLLLRGRQLAPDAIAERFERWNRGPLQSFLIELTARVLKHTDAATGEPLVTQILDQAGQKGTGRWSIHAALTLGIAAPTIGAAVDARLLSAHKAPRQQHAAHYNASPAALDLTDEELESALLTAKLFAYAQGFHLLSAASDAFDWSLELAAIARVWTGGCIIRAALLAPIMEVHSDAATPTELMLSQYAQALVAQHLEALRSVVAKAQTSGLPVPALSASLSWYDALRSSTLPQNLIQAQRDAFGHHGFTRTETPDRTQHHKW
jgi:6-phosphogluconate dehydrogenase